MRDIIKYLIFGAFRALGVYRLRRRKNRDKAIVLTYHGVVPEIPPGEDWFEYRNFVTTAQFENQVKFLLKHYRPLKAADLYNSSANIGGGFLITFDDGFRNNYRHAMPVLKKYGLEGCFFITTKLIGTREFLWTEQVTRLLEKTRRPRVEINIDQPRTFELNGTLQREQASQAIRRHMKRLPSAQLKKVLAQLKSQLSDVVLEVGAAEEERYLFMAWEEVREMICAGQHIGSHTHTHPILKTLNEQESLEELRLSKEAIEKHTGQPCLTISYPNGEKEDYSETQIRQLKELGYRCAFTQVPLYNTGDTDRYQLRRVNISLKMSLPVFEAALCGMV